jgi:pimeloyl-ACP methyl ester carboxylesterase
VSGLPLWVESAGPPPGPEVETFLLLHGYGASMFTWRHWAPRLATRGRVLLIDLKGHGRAPKPPDRRYEPAHQAELVHELIRRRDPERLTLVGHSLGGGIALLVALRLMEDERSCLQRLVLVSSVAYEQRTPPAVRLASYPRLCSLFLRMVGPEFVVKAVLRSVVYDASRVEASQARGYAEPLRSPETVRALCDAALQIVPNDLDRLAARYPQIEVPTLLLWGRHDRVVPLEVGERLERELPNARLHVLERCGHLPPEEAPEESYAVLERFLDG